MGTPLPQVDNILEGEDEVRLGLCNLVMLKENYKRSLEALFEQNKEVCSHVGIPRRQTGFARHSTSTYAHEASPALT